MGKRIVIFALGLLVISCSRSAAPPNNGGGGGDNPSLLACNSNTDCTAVSGEVCDFHFPTGGKSGTCLTACDPTDANGACAKSGRVCSPISGACEPTCTGCAAQTGNSNAQCMAGKNYCAITVGGGCPANFAPSAGFCKFASSTGCTGGLGKLVADPITGTCEFGCTTANDTCNANLSSLQLSSTTTINYACSPITARCVQGCSTAQQSTCLGKRNSCYSPGGTAVPSGTCEQPCSSGSCTSFTGFSCVEQICQQACTQDSCKNNTDAGRTTCDLIDKVCRVGCDITSPNCGTGQSCSVISSTCWASCTVGPPDSCSARPLRNKCLSYLTQNTCEASCLIAQNGQPLTNNNSVICSISGATEPNYFYMIACQDGSENPICPVNASCIAECLSGLQCNSYVCKPS